MQLQLFLNVNITFVWKASVYTNFVYLLFGFGYGIRWWQSKHKLQTTRKMLSKKDHKIKVLCSKRSFGWYIACFWSQNFLLFQAHLLLRIVTAFLFKYTFVIVYLCRQQYTFSGVPILLWISMKGFICCLLYSNINCFASDKSFMKMYLFIYFTIQIPPDYYTTDFYLKCHSWKIIIAFIHFRCPHII